MTTTIRLRIKKDIDAATEKKILKLKGNLIAQSFTDIIHFDDEGEDYYINYFTVAPAIKDEVMEHIHQNIEKAGLMTIMELLASPSAKK